MKRSLAVALSLALVLPARTLIIPEAMAQTAAKPVAASRPPAPLARSLTGAAKTDYDTARLLVSNGDFNGALLKFQAAYDQSKDPRLLWNVAFCEKNLRHYAKVVTLVRRYKEEGASMITAKDAQDADELLQTLRSLTSTLKIHVSEPNAAITIDDEAVGNSPLAEPLLVDIGARHLKVTKEGFLPHDTTITVGNAPEAVVEVKLQEEVHEGRLLVRAKDGDAITVDGTLVGTTRWEGKIRAGGHTLRVTNKGMRPYQQEVSIQDKETRTIEVTLDSEGLKVPTWAWIVGGTVLASGAAVGGYFLFRPGDPARASVPSGNVDPGIVPVSRSAFR